jgi:CsoR family transcriptional regulator, copper-sensing transcriptional repressor
VAGDTETEVIQRLKRIEGQVRGIQRMVEEKRGCDEIITQVMAARAALENLAAIMVVTHVDDCMAKMSPGEAKSNIARAVHLLTKLS